MDLTESDIAQIAAWAPGDFVIAKVSPQKIDILRYSAGVPTISGVSDEEYRRLITGKPFGVILEDDVDNMVHAIEDRTASLAAASEAPDGPAAPLEVDADCAFRIFNSRTGYVWVQSKARVIGMMDGTPVVLAILVCNPSDSELYRDIVENIDSMVYLSDLHTCEMLFANKAARDNPQNEHRSYAGLYCNEYIWNRDTRCTWCFIDRMKPGDEVRFDCQDPATGRWKRICGKTIEWCGHDALIQVVEDVTETHNAEEHYRNSVQEMVNANPQALCAFRLNLTRNTCYEEHGTSPYISALLRSETVDGLMSNIAGTITSAADRDAFLSLFAREKLLAAFESGRTDVSFEYRRMIEDEKTHWVATYLSMIRNPLSGDVEAVAYSEDIDDRKTEEEAAKLTTAVTCDYIAFIDPELPTFTFMEFDSLINESTHDEFRSEHGAEPYQSAVDAAIASWVHPDDREAFRQSTSLPTIVERLSTSERYEFGIRSVEEDGSVRRKQMLYAYLDDQRSTIVVWQLDVTDTFLHEQENAQRLESALEDAEKADEMKSDFLSSVSHDMRTPLNAVLGYARLASKTDDIETIRGYLEKIMKSGGVLQQLIDDTLDLNKISTGITVLKPAPIAANAILSDLITAITPSMEAKGIHFVYDVSGCPMKTIDADVVRIREVLLNLLNNAVKFTPVGGTVTFLVRRLSADGDIAHDLVTISDTGCGMSAAFLPKAFEPLSQERTEANSGIGGTGLGLSIVKRLLDLMGARIEVESKLGQGTTFSLYFDFKIVPDVDSKTVAKKPPEARSLRGTKVLLVEDNAMNTEIACALLENEGVKVTCARNGSEGVSRFEQSAPYSFDAILMDIRMPVMGGYDASRAIRTLERDDAKEIPIIAMSADAYETDVEKSIAAGMNAHIAKPVDPQKLFDVLGGMLGDRS